MPIALICFSKPALAASPAGDVVGKVTVGYQGWFACAGDGSPQNNWTHWANNSSQLPSPANPHPAAWPDMREYTSTYQTGYANLGNGQPAKLFSSYDQQTVNTHVLWMQQNNIDTIALQRFGGGNTDSIAPKVRAAAETYGRKFYLMYDFGGFNSPQPLKDDWNNKGKAFISSPAYAKQNGKPVVCMWGIGMKMTPAENLELINFFKSEGCYVIGGVGRGWRGEAAWISTYQALNMISPWLIGAVGSVGDADGIYNNYMIGDQSYCNSNSMDYQPCVLPGDLSLGQRSHGDLMWRMFYNATRVGCQGIYISMYDEYCEGNQIAKTAENTSMMPTNYIGKALDEDGTACSSDYYLRLTGDGGRMLKGQIGLTATRPTSPMPSTFTKKLVVGTTVSLRAYANNQYVCADNAGASALIANRGTAGTWEHYLVVDAGGGNVALRATANNQYVCAANTGLDPLIANRSSFGFWETFTEVDAGGGRSGMRALVNNQYVCADNTGTSPLIANRSTVGTWESFTVAP